MSFSAAGQHDRLVAQVVGGHALGVGPGVRGDDDVAVLDAGVEGDLAAAQLGLQRGDDLSRPAGRRVPAGKVDHRAVGSDRGQVAAEGHLVGGQAQAQGGGLDRGPARVVHGGVIAQDREVAHVAARRQAGGDDRGPAHRAPGGEALQRGQVGRLERRAPAEPLGRLVGTPVGDAHHVLHRASLALLASDSALRGVESGATTITR